MGVNLSRVREVSAVLKGEGLGLVLGLLKLQEGRSRPLFIGRIFEKLIGLFISVGPDPLPVKLRRMLERLGPTFIKLGQILSLRFDLIPKEYRDELSKLQRSVDSFPFETVVEIVEAEIHGKLSDVFSTFNREPLAAASIAQVHEATLLTGEHVVVKIKRPGIDKVVLADLSIMLWLARRLEKVFPIARRMQLFQLCQSFAIAHREQLDFCLEAKHAEKFAVNFKDDPDIYVPRLYSQYTTSKIIVMEKLLGRSLDPMETLVSDGYDPSDVAKKLLKCILEQLFLFGLFHADIHPGNFILLPDKRIGLIDFGLVGKIPRLLQNQVFRTTYYSSIGNHEEAADALIEMSHFAYEANIEHYRRDIIEVMENYYHKAKGDQSFSVFELQQQEAEIAIKYQVSIPHEFVMLGRALAMVFAVYGQIVKIDYHELQSEIEGIVKTIMKKRFDVGRLLDDAKSLLPEFLELIELAPVVARRYIGFQRNVATMEWPKQLARSESPFGIFAQREKRNSSYGFFWAPTVVSWLCFTCIVVIFSIQKIERSLFGYDLLAVMFLAACGVTIFNWLKGK